MILTMDQTRQEQMELLPFDFGKFAENDCVYTLDSTNIVQSAPNLVKMCVTIRSRMSWIMGMGPIRREQQELFALGFRKLLNLTVTLEHL